MAEKKEFSEDNLEIRKDRNQVIVSINPKVYTLDIIFSAAYIFIDRAYVVVDGDPNEEIFVFLKAKDKKTDLLELGREFNNELINYSFYAAQTIKNIHVRDAIIQRAFFTHSGEERVIMSGKGRSRRKKKRSKN